METATIDHTQVPTWQEAYLEHNRYWNEGFIDEYGAMKIACIPYANKPFTVAMYMELFQLLKEKVEACHNIELKHLYRCEGGFELVPAYGPLSKEDRGFTLQIRASFSGMPRKLNKREPTEAELAQELTPWGSDLKTPEGFHVFTFTAHKHVPRKVMLWLKEILNNELHFLILETYGFPDDDDETLGPFQDGIATIRPHLVMIPEVLPPKKRLRFL